LFAAPTSASAQQQPTPASRQALNEGVTAVLVDVVVRDKRGSR
jgi:hypothetical protein